MQAQPRRSWWSRLWWSGPPDVPQLNLTGDGSESIENPSERTRHALEQLRLSCIRSSIDASKRASRWTLVARFVGIPATALAAAGGAIALEADYRVWGALMALSAAALTGIVSSLNPSEKAERSEVEIRRLAVLERDLSLVLHVDQESDPELLRKVLEIGIERLDSIRGLPPSAPLLESARGRRDALDQPLSARRRVN